MYLDPSLGSSVNIVSLRGPVLGRLLTFLLSQLMPADTLETTDPSSPPLLIPMAESAQVYIDSISDEELINSDCSIAFQFDLTASGVESSPALSKAETGVGEMPRVVGWEPNET